MSIGILRMTVVDLGLLAAYIIANFLELNGISNTAYAIVRGVNWNLVFIEVFWDRPPNSGVLDGGISHLFNWSFLVLLAAVALNLAALWRTHVHRVAAARNLQNNGSSDSNVSFFGRQAFRIKSLY